MKRRIIASLVTALLLESVLVAPSPRVQAQEPSSQPAVDARIQIVWPHDEQGNFAPVSQSTRVNIAVDIFEHGTLQSVPLDYPPPPTEPGIGESIGLYVARGSEETRFPPLRSAAWAHSQKVAYTANGQTFPRWIFNDVPVEPGNQFHFLVQMIGGPPTYSTIWTHAEDARTILPHPEAPPPCLPW